MALAMPQSRPVAPWPLVLGGGRTRHVAARSAPCCPPHPAQGLSGGRGGEARRLALRAGPQALSQVGARLEERGMIPLLQPGLTRASLHDDRLGQSLEALFAVPLNRVFGALALHALEVSTMAPPGRHQETTTLSLYGAYEEAARPGEGLVPPRPAYGPSPDGREDRKHVRLRRGVSRDGLPRRMGLRDGHPSDRTETPVALEACVALGLDGGRGIVADSQA